MSFAQHNYASSRPLSRTTPDRLIKQIQQLSDTPYLEEFFDKLPTVVLILNRERQIVFANQSLLDFVQKDRRDSVCGFRPGELFECIHSDEHELGCGMTEFCQECGAARAIGSSQQGRSEIKECRISQKDNTVLELRVWATPFQLKDEHYTLFSMSDISHEKRRRALERIFFHDILNTAGGLKSFSALLLNADNDELEEYSQIISELSDRLLEEINEQRDLLAAESGELQLDIQSVQSRHLLQNLEKTFKYAEQGCRLVIESACDDTIFETDRVLLNRVLVNMIKNAIEASKSDDTVTIGCKRDKDHIIFKVHNSSHIPRPHQLQIFQRSFTTKGTGRGLGTYSMQLLSKKYLKGHVTFESTPEKGTTFYAAFPVSFYSS
ncbi:GHKL domain-containing protein [candidate division KSB1 bacterium]|nr:GHKL domain-containing protein [candidate division KSB1 bacterium]